ncbi:hypothetical protein M404DRAFT_998743 [Pisolithus tinctorius Marx 270]|uniref:Uncharacterized protein n=1 Tax=Pisolithus tinctorius Marx 270 TaxID=870435 RepID=A0A0C3PFC3_PISTI|nr:hypothetical protein M404DRAFT_998743 [Pisolithus tinctorius Marx 270]
MKAGVLDSKVANTYSHRSMLTEGRREGLFEEDCKRWHLCNFQSHLRNGMLRTPGISRASTDEGITLTARRTSRRYDILVHHRTDGGICVTT